LAAATLVFVVYIRQNFPRLWGSELNLLDFLSGTTCYSTCSLQETGKPILRFPGAATSVYWSVELSDRRFHFTERSIR